MLKVNIHQAKTQLSKLLITVQKGNEVIIAKAGHPIAIIKSIDTLKPKRKPGSLKGKFKIPTNFDDPLPNKILKLFYEE